MSRRYSYSGGFIGQNRFRDNNRLTDSLAPHKAGMDRYTTNSNNVKSNNFNSNQPTDKENMNPQKQFTNNESTVAKKSRGLSFNTNKNTISFANNENAKTFGARGHNNNNNNSKKRRASLGALSAYAPKSIMKKVCCLCACTFLH